MPAIFHARSLLLPLCLLASSAFAFSLADLSNQEAGSGSKIIGKVFGALR